MAMKTVLRQLLGKWGPTSTEMQKVEQMDDKSPIPIQEPNKTMIDIDVETGEVISAAPVKNDVPAEEKSQQPDRAPFLDDILDE